MVLLLKQAPALVLVAFALLQCASHAAAQNSTQAFQCGQPLGPCGAAIPKGVNCPKGPGWCPSGYYCGWTDNTLQPSSCLPIPKDCGKAGNPCCPSNALTPHTKPDDLFDKKPTCSDGSYCFYFPPQRGLNNGDFYAGVKGAYNCALVPKDCGTLGKPCCPGLYKAATNPAFPDPKMGQICSRGGDSAFCDYDVTPPNAAPSTTAPPAYPKGTCVTNKPDCGQFGKSCCIFTGGAATGTQCGGTYNKPGPKGYCAGPNGQQMYVKNSDLVCRQCPPDASNNPQKYFGC